MIIYSADHGHTIVDNFDEQDLESQIWEMLPCDEEADAWSGSPYDWFQSDSDYTRPNLF